MAALAVQQRSSLLVVVPRLRLVLRPPPPARPAVLLFRLQTRVIRRVVKLANLLLIADGAEMSLPSIGRTSRDAFGSVSALTALPLTSLLPRTPSYSISRSEIIAHGLKRSHCGDSHTSLPSIRTSPPRVAFASAAAMSPSPSTSLTFHVPAPPSAKRLRRESLSPTSVGEVSTAKKPSAAKPAAAATPGATQMQSILRGLRHLSACSSSGCSNPLCVSTRAFVDKVKAHRSNTTGQATHDATRCGACKLWGAILRAHAPTCACRATCRVPGCPPQP